MPDDFTFDTQLTVLDRSTLERYAVCPAQARFVETGAVRSVGQAAIVGTEVHNAIGRTLSDYVTSSGAYSPRELQDQLESELRQSRPDVQPEVIRAFRKSVWAWRQFISGIHVGNILRFDGGEGNRSGQLALDVERLSLRLTSEVDLLLATASKEVVEEIDYKTGHKYWTENGVSDAFQFCFHAWLILGNYPEVNCVRISIWNTRQNVRTYAVEFTRERFQEYETRIMSAVSEWHMNKSKPPEQAETWPSREACAICDARALCPSADRDIATEPVEALRQLVAVEARADALKELLNAHVDASGDDVRLNGVCYGIGKPKAVRKPTKALYLTKGEEHGDGD